MSYLLNFDMALLLVACAAVFINGSTLSDTSNNLVDKEASVTSLGVKGTTSDPIGIILLTHRVSRATYDDTGKYENTRNKSTNHETRISDDWRRDREVDRTSSVDKTVQRHEESNRRSTGHSSSRDRSRFPDRDVSSNSDRRPTGRESRNSGSRVSQRDDRRTDDRTRNHDDRMNTSGDRRSDDQFRNYDERRSSYGGRRPFEDNRRSDERKTEERRDSSRNSNRGSAHDLHRDSRERSHHDRNEDRHTDPCKGKCIHRIIIRNKVVCPGYSQQQPTMSPIQFNTGTPYYYY